MPGGACIGNSGGRVNLLLSDADTPASALLLRASSSNTSLVPDKNIVFGGSGSNRTLTVTAASGKSGIAKLTVEVSDGFSKRSLLLKVVVGTGKSDQIIGSTGANILLGGDGNDLLIGGDGDDVLCGGDGKDSLYAGAGSDTLFGQDGSDTLFGQDGDDLMYAGDGNDTLTGGAGRDLFDGGDGRDSAADYSPARGDTLRNIP